MAQIAVTSLSFDWWLVPQMNPDEGINLVKAALVADGASPYGEMWNDQPPVLTYLLAVVHHAWPGSVAAARGLVLATAALMVFSLYRIVHREVGHAGAVVAAVLLLSSPLALQLSASVMIGLPAVAFAVAAIDIAGSGLRPGLLRASLSGLAMAVSLQTKLFTFSALPSWLATLWTRDTGSETGRKMRLAAGIAAMAIGFVALILLSGAPLFEQLVGTHLSQKLRSSYDPMVALGSIWAVLRQHLPLLAICGLGAALGSRTIVKSALPALLWLLVSSVSLAVHTPVWDHQVLLIVVPLAWIGGIGWGGVAQDWRADRRMRLALLPLLPLLGWAAVNATSIPLSPGAGIETRDRDVAAQVARFASLGPKIATDMPIQAFRAGLDVPPELAVFSMKRVLQGGLDAAELIRIIEEESPTQVLMGRFGLPEAVHAYLADDYWQLPFDGPPHFVRKGAVLAGFDRDSAREGLVELLRRVTSTAVDGGGYAGLLDPASGARYERFATETPLGNRDISMRPVGSTPRIGQCLLDVAALSGENDLRDAAIETGRAVVCGQSREGGWAAAARLPASCPAVEPPLAPTTTNRSDTLDDGTPNEAVALLLRLAALAPADAERFTASARAGLDFLVNAQNPDGGWPLKLSSGGYSAYSTLNDGVTSEAIAAMVKGFTAFGDPRYRDAALRGVQFLLDVQAENGAWAQQFDAQGKPAKARAFEPVAYSSLETAYAMRTIADFYALTESDTLKLSLQAAQAWLEANRLPTGGWARFYEIGSDRPVFGDRDGSVHYEIEAISAERRAGYRWIEDFPEVTAALKVATAAGSGPAAVPHAVARAERDARLLSITDNRDALRAFAQSGGVGAELNPDGMLSLRQVVETCEMVLEALETSGI